MQRAAADGDVVIGPATLRLVRGAAIVTPIGSDADGTGDTRPASAWRVLDVPSHAPGVPHALDAPMVGRQRELTTLRSALRRAVRAGAVVRVNIVGDAGLGKSRLARELVSSVDADHVTLHCPVPGDVMTLLPLREAVIEAAGVHGWRGLHQLLADGDGDSLGQLAESIGLRAEPDNAAPLVAAMRRLIEALAQVKPLVVVLEDLHWAEPTFLDIVDDLAAAARGPILLLCLARPELAEHRPSWPTADADHLEPLAADDVERLIRGRAGAIAPGEVTRIVELSQGNPLFAEQLLVALTEGDIDTVPRSLRGLLTMRLDQLGPGERDVLLTASVVGAECDRDILTAVLPDDAAPHLGRHLDALEQKRLVTRTQDGMRFVHVLIRLAAYRSMTRDDRTQLHQRVARCLHERTPDAPPELEAAIRFHTEHAATHRPGTAPERRDAAPGP